MAEKEYIEREALLRHLNGIWLSAKPNDSMPDDDRQLAIVRCMGLNDAMDAVKSLPAADVRPVVLCRDCKHYELDNGWCEYFDADRVFGDYCSEGEKREES